MSWWTRSNGFSRSCHPERGAGPVILSEAKDLLFAVWKSADPSAAVRPQDDKRYTVNAIPISPTTATSSAPGTANLSHRP